jgi:uncharacterized protein (TIGR02145 family)
LPSDNEWQTIVDFAGGAEVAGNILKASSGWNGVDIFSFSALPGGGGYSNGNFSSVGYNGSWWSSTESNASRAYYRYISYDNADVYRGGNGKTDLFSVRCVQD